jgi:phage baseplate assembly protein V
MVEDHYARLWRQPRTHTAFRSGLVVAQQLSPPSVRVQFPDRDNIISYWLPVLTKNTQTSKDFWMPEIGEQVAVLMDSNDEHGAVIGGVWSTVDNAVDGTPATTRSTTFADGTVIEYDFDSHTMNVSLCAGGLLVVQTEAGNYIRIDGSGNIKLQAGGSGEITTNGSISIDGLHLFAPHLPTSPAGLPPNEVWVDSSYYLHITPP